MVLPTKLPTTTRYFSRIHPETHLKSATEPQTINSQNVLMEKNETMHFRNLLKTFDSAVLITHGQRTHFSSRPMVIARVEDNCDLWFITNQDSAKVHEIEADTRSHAVCQNGRSSCVTVSGHACIVRDRATIDELWRPAYRVWFPD